jgi:sigma-E factor negative regulatory protein RseC
MRDQGIVFKVDNNLAWIEFSSSAACAQCGICRPGASGKMAVEAENLLGAKVGEKVEVEISPVITTLFPLIAFGVPVILFFIGLALGSLISESGGIILGLLSLVLGFVIVKAIDKYVAGRKKFIVRIIRIVKD